jgi:hypothetical protein
MPNNPPLDQNSLPDQSAALAEDSVDGFDDGVSVSNTAARGDPGSPASAFSSDVPVSGAQSNVSGVTLPGTTPHESSPTINLSALVADEETTPTESSALPVALGTQAQAPESAPHTIPPDEASQGAATNHISNTAPYDPAAHSPPPVLHGKRQIRSKRAHQFENEKSLKTVAQQSAPPLQLRDSVGPYQVSRLCSTESMLLTLSGSNSAAVR